MNGIVMKTMATLMAMGTLASGVNRLPALTIPPSGGNSSKETASDPVLQAAFFDDDYFYQLNTAILLPEIYTHDAYDRLNKNNPQQYAYDDTVDVSHIIEAYVAPVTEDGISYMSPYDYTYVYSCDELTTAFMKEMKMNKTLRKQIMTEEEYSDLVSVYNGYVKDSTYDVNSYVYHYIAEYIDITYGEKLFDYDFYCATYPSLALLFEYDEEALKQHFYSVGMFEGRQGIATFNVDRYTRDDDDFGFYYIQYAIASDASETYEKTESDATQIRLYDVGFDSYVADVEKDHKSATFRENLACPYVQGELNAQVCHRVRFQLGDPTAQGHNAMRPYLNSKNILSTWKVRFTLRGCNGGENAWTSKVNSLNRIPNLTDSMDGWRQCDDHYQAAISDQYVYVGQSHPYVDYNPNYADADNPGVGIRKNKYVVTVMSWMYNEKFAEVVDAFYE